MRLTPLVLGALFGLGAALVACSESRLDDNAQTTCQPTNSNPCTVANEGVAPLTDGGATEAVTVPFLALSESFAGFDTWTRIDLGEHATSDDVHLAGHRYAYINRMPAPGSTEFAPGTLVVKVVETGSDRATWQLFGMSKRGGSFNPLGAIGWEWFGLTWGSSGAVVIEWRGMTPPADAGYGGGVGGACNRCHGTAVANDFVLTPGIRLQGAP